MTKNNLKVVKPIKNQELEAKEKNKENFVEINHSKQE